MARKTPNRATAHRLYRLLAWLSPAFPVGGFSYSHGLETAISEGRITDRATLERWIAGILAHGGGRTDAMLFCAAWRAVRSRDRAAFVRAAEWAAAMRGSAELALESTAQGEAFLSTLAAAWPAIGLAPWRQYLREADVTATYPVAVALAAACAGVPLAPALAGYLQAFAAGLVAAGLKLIPLGQTDGQRLIAALEEVVLACADNATTRPISELGSAAPIVDLLSMRHESQYTRLFRS